MPGVRPTHAGEVLPVKRRLFTLLSVLSLLLFVAVVGMWIQSHMIGFSLGRTSRKVDGRYLVEEGWGLFSDRGSLGYARSSFRESLAFRASYDPNPPQLLDRRGFVQVADAAHVIGPIRDGDDFLHEMGFAWDATRANVLPVGEDERYYVMVPHWFPLLFTLPLPAYALARKVRRHIHSWHLRRAGQCPSCGYDLRATPDRRPECGTARATSA